VSQFLTVWHEFTHFFTWAVQHLASVFAFAGNDRWALAIIALTLIVRTLLLPVAVKQIKSMRDTQRLSPEMTRLRQKYKNDRQKMTEEVMELYRREGVNPYASCLPLIAQWPVLYVMFRVIRDLTSVPKAAAAKIAAAHHIGIKSPQIAQIARSQGLIPRMPFFGLGDLSKAALTTPAGWVLLILTTAAQWFQTRQLNPGGTDQQQRMQQLMPLFFVVIMVRFPGALVLYWTTQTVYGFVQQNVMLRGWSVKKWFSKAPLTVPPARSAPSPASPPRPAPAAAPVPAAQSFGSAVGLAGNQVVRRDISDRRKQRRKKKKRKRR
jgi:YidC/Oxa1 family membrane protein insertase